MASGNGVEALTLPLKETDAVTDGHRWFVLVNERARSRRQMAKQKEVSKDESF